MIQDESRCEEDRQDTQHSDDPANSIGPGGVLVVSLLERLVVVPGEDEDDEDCERGEEHVEDCHRPLERPDHLDSCHIVDILDKVWIAVYVGDDQKFAESYEEERPRGRVEVEKIQQVWTSGTAQWETEDEEDDANGADHQGLLGDELWSEVQDSGEESLDDGELRVQSESEEHEEEEDGPEGGGGEPGHQVGIRLEGQSSSSSGDIRHVHTELSGHEAQHGEDGEARGEGCEAVADADDEGVPDDVVVEPVVAGESDEAAPGHGEREEDLDSGRLPDFDVRQPGEVWSEVEADAERGSLQGDGPDEEDDEHHVGEGGRHVDHLPAGLDPFDQAEEDDDPGQHQAEGQLPVGLPKSAASMLM